PFQPHRNKVRPIVPFSHFFYKVPNQRISYFACVRFSTHSGVTGERALRLCSCARIAKLSVLALTLRKSLHSMSHHAAPRQTSLLNQSRQFEGETSWLSLQRTSLRNSAIPTWKSCCQRNRFALASPSSARRSRAIMWGSIRF